MAWAGRTAWIVEGRRGRSGSRPGPPRFVSLDALLKEEAKRVPSAEGERIPVVGPEFPGREDELPVRLELEKLTAQTRDARSAI